MSQIYIHYGSDHFDPLSFTPIRNSAWQPKPENGLWASRDNAEYGWSQWCRSNRFNVDALRESFRFTLPEARILLLEDLDQLMNLPKLRAWEPKKVDWLESIKPNELPTKEQLQELYMPNWCYLDYEKLSEQYDAVEIREPWVFRDAFPTWDCDSIVVMNENVIITE